MDFARAAFTPGRLECSQCLEDWERYGDTPNCWQSIACLMATRLWPENVPAWRAYQHVAGCLSPLVDTAPIVAAILAALGGRVDMPAPSLPPLDQAAVIRVLDWRGFSPEDPEERAELLDKLLLIHNARRQALSPTRQAPGNED